MAQFLGGMALAILTGMNLRHFFSSVVFVAFFGVAPCVAQTPAWLQRARLVAVDPAGGSSLVSWQERGQSLQIFSDALQMIQAFEGAPLVSQERQTGALSELEVLENPLLLYRTLPDSDLTLAAMSEVDEMMTAVFRVLAKTDFPARFLESPMKARVDKALRKMHLSQMIDMAKRQQVSNEVLFYLRELGQESAKSRVQNHELVHPELNSSDRQALSAFLGGFLWRFRGAGGYADLGTNERRDLFVQKGFAAIARLNGAPTSTAAAIALVLRAGVQSTGWGRYHDMGRLPGEDRFHDFIQMEKLGRGMVRMTKQTLQFLGYSKDAIYITLAGATMASCYAYAWEKIPLDYKVGVDLGEPYLFIFGAPTNFGEYCTGASLGIALHKIMMSNQSSGAQ
ncbi:MAG: hypothetical protein ACK5P7_05230 [Bdellovibrio sp.]